MSIRRRCAERSCTNGRRCFGHLVFDMMWQGRRHRVPVNTFAIPRMEPGKQRPIQSMEEARDWERVFVGEVKAGRDPSRPPARSAEVPPTSATPPRSSMRTGSAASNRRDSEASVRSRVDCRF